MPLLTPFPKRPKRNGRPPTPPAPHPTAAFAFSLREVNRLLHSKHPTIDTNELFTRWQLFFLDITIETMFEEFMKGHPRGPANNDFMLGAYSEYKRLKSQMEKTREYLSWMQRNNKGELEQPRTLHPELKPMFDKFFAIRNKGIQFNHFDRGTNVLPNEGATEEEMQMRAPSESEQAQIEQFARERKQKDYDLSRLNAFKDAQ